MNLNKVIIAGRVSQAPELRSTSSGQPVASMGVATNKVWTDREAKKHEDAQFHAVVIWGKLAETASAFLTKGSTVLVEGHLETRSWEDKDGVNRKVTEIIAENIQFGARPTTSSPAPENGSMTKRKTESVNDDVTLVAEGGDEEDTGRSLSPLFPDHSKVDEEEIPF